MNDPVGVRGVIVGHGEMARGLIDAVRRIAGDSADALRAVSNTGKSPEGLCEDVEAAAGPGPAIVFTDLQAGSCGVAAAHCCRDTDGRTLVSGVNLPMLLDFVFHRELPLEELAGRLVEKGREAIHTTPARG